MPWESVSKIFLGDPDALLERQGSEKRKIHMKKFIGNIYFTVSTEQRLLKSNLLTKLI